MITSQGRYEPTPGAIIKLWPIGPIEASVAAQDIPGMCALCLNLGGSVVKLFDQDAESLEKIGHTIIRLAEEQRRAAARLSMAEPLQEK